MRCNVISIVNNGLYRVGIYNYSLTNGRVRVSLARAEVADDVYVSKVLFIYLFRSIPKIYEPMMANDN